MQGGRRQTKAEPEGRGSPAELVDCRATVERSKLEAMVEPTGQQPRRNPGEGSRGKLRPRQRWRMAVPPRSHRIDGGLRVSRGAARRQQWRRQEWVGGRDFGERALEGALEARALEDTFGERALEGALEARALENAFGEQAQEPSMG